MDRYRYDEDQPGADSFSLPGLWFNASEVHALLSMDILCYGADVEVLAPPRLREKVKAELQKALENYGGAG